ncbi:MAG: DNA polymerase/3'-5' exonuclease PolX [Armatimonadota bacterium]
MDGREGSAMDNREIAKAFEQIAHLMEVDGADRFRVRSYENVARTIRELGQSVEAIAEAGELESIPRVGKSTAGKIEELLETGKITALEELKAKFPAGLLDMLEIPGMGPKKVALVYNELGIGDVDALAEAAEGGELRELEGMGAKTEENVLRGIKVYREGQERALLGEVLPVAEQIVAKLKGLKGVKAASTAGSLRRGRETIGDIDVLAAAKDSGRVCQAFQEFEELREVILAGDTKVSAYLEEGGQIDLRVVEPESWGAALMYFTGSKEHNIVLRQRAIDRGLKLSEYGLFREEDEEKRVAGKTEEQVYKKLGLPYIEPELREDRGEVEAAENGELPALVRLRDIKGDLQMHTTGSDGANTLEEMVEACRARGYKYMAITDHSQSLTVAEGLSPRELEKQIEAVRKLNEELDDLEVLAGNEVDIKPDGSLDYPEELLRELDLVLASIHAGFSSDVERITGRIVTAFETGLVDVFSHPTGRLIGRREAYGIDIERVIQAAKDTDTALEINAYPERLDLSDVHCRMAKQAGVKIAINTDAHSTGMLDYMRFGVLTARRGWLEKKDVVNTWPRGRLLKWLRRR